MSATTEPILGKGERFRVIEGDCLAVLATLPDASVDLVLTDPPYFRVKDEPWDRQWDDAGAFLAWLGSVLSELRRVLAPNGSLYLFASPQMARPVENEVAARFRVLNSVRWYKREGWHNKSDETTLRSFLTPWEAVIFAEHNGADAIADDASGYSAECAELHKQVYAPVGAKVRALRERSGFKRWEIDCACSPSQKPTGLCYRWEEGACLPTPDQYAILCRIAGVFPAHVAQNYADLRREYESCRVRFEELRVRFEELRRPFLLNESDPSSDLWDFPAVLPHPGKHPCEKPQALLRHVVKASSRPGALVLDCFAGSGSTGAAALSLGRRFVGVEAAAHWARRARENCRTVADAHAAGLPFEGAASTAALRIASSQPSLFAEVAP